MLLDEDVPVQMVEPLRRLLPTHEVEHVDERGWKRKQDVFLIADAKRAGFDVFVTNDDGQLHDPDETAAIKRSGLHHVRYSQKRKGLEGLALAMGSLFAAMPRLIAQLEAAGGQRLVMIAAISPDRRFNMSDPVHDPPAYWPR